MRKLLLCAGYASRVLALDDIGKLLRKLGMIFLYDLTVLDEIDRNVGGLYIRARKDREAVRYPP